MVGVHDGSHDVSTESRTDLIQQVLIFLSALGILIRADFQLRAVGGEAAGKAGRNTRAQVAANHGRAHQADLRLLLLEQVHEDIRVRGGGIRKEALAVKNEEFVHAVREDLVFHFSFDTGTGHHGVQFHAQRVGELAALGQQLLGNFGNDSAFNFTINKYVVHIPNR